MEHRDKIGFVLRKKRIQSKIDELDDSTYFDRQRRVIFFDDLSDRKFAPRDGHQLSDLRPLLRGPVYVVLGNHDSLRMAPIMEAMGIRMLFNEHEPIGRGGSRIYLAGVDDAHFYRADDGRLRQPSPKMPFRYCYRIHRRFTSKPRQQDSISC